MICTVNAIILKTGLSSWHSLSCSSSSFYQDSSKKLCVPAQNILSTSLHPVLKEIFHSFQKISEMTFQEQSASAENCLFQQRMAMNSVRSSMHTTWWSNQWLNWFIMFKSKAKTLRKCPIHCLSFPNKPERLLKKYLKPSPELLTSQVHRPKKHKKA